MKLRHFAAMFVVIGTFAPFHAAAQIRGSERGIISQVSNGTTVTIDYGRPHVRGRTPVFGGLVEWGHVWTPGANEATTFEATADVTLNGRTVPQGRYSMWLIPAESDWEMVLDPRATLYHTQPPEPASDQIRLRVTPQSAEHTEALTFAFPHVDPMGMDMEFRWGGTRVLFRIDVPIPPRKIVAPEQAERMVGLYTIAFEGPPPAETPPGAAMPRVELTVEYRDGRLIGTLKSGPPVLPGEFELIPVTDFVFNPGWMKNGQVYETEVDMYFEFLLDGGRATGFEVRGLEDRLMMSAQRVP